MCGIEIDDKRKVLYIPSSWILPNTNGFSFRDRCRAFDEAFKMTYCERAKAYATSEQYNKIMSCINAHRDYAISEYSNI